MLKKSTWLPKIAVEDIQVLKGLKMYKDGNKHVYYTPFAGDAIKSNVLKGNGLLQRIISILFKRRIGKGFVHSYLTLNPFEREQLNDAGYTLVKAYIPQGSLYYLDKTNGNVASTKLILCDRRIKNYLKRIDKD